MQTEQLTLIWYQYKNLFVIGGMCIVVSVFVGIIAWDFFTFEGSSQNVQDTTKEYLDSL